MAKIDLVVQGMAKGIWQVEEKVSLLLELWCLQVSYFEGPSCDEYQPLQGDSAEES